MNKKTQTIIGMICLILGALLFVFVGAASVWGGYEATFFDAGRITTARVTTLRCPVFITPNEYSTISAKFTNPNDKPITLRIRAHVSDGFVILMREFLIDLPLQAGETQTVEWPIFPSDAAYGKLVLVRVHQMPASHLPYHNASCGVVLVNIPFLTGTQFVFLVMSLGVLLTAGGIALWVFNSRPIVWSRLSTFRVIISFAVTSLLSAVTGLLGKWGLSTIFTALWVLMAVGMIWHFTTTSTNDAAQYESME